MNTADILSTVSLIAYIAAGVCLVLAIAFWFFFKIPTVIGNLSGRTAKKSIEKMRQTNIRTGNKSYRSSPTNAERGKLTDTMQHASKLKNEKPAEKQPVEKETGIAETSLLSENRAVDYTENATQALSEETELLVDENATTALTPPETVKRMGGKKLTMINDIMLIHTDEVLF